MYLPYSARKSNEYLIAVTWITSIGFLVVPSPILVLTCSYYPHASLCRVRYEQWVYTVLYLKLALRLLCF
jgi:hypothetical protein